MDAVNSFKECNEVLMFAYHLFKTKKNEKNY